jgi:hypothetical protein
MRCAAFGGLAYEKTQSALRAFVRFFVGTFCLRIFKIFI